MLKEPEKTPGAGRGAVEEKKRPLGDTKKIWDEMLPSYVEIIS